MASIRSRNEHTATDCVMTTLHALGIVPPEKEKNAITKGLYYSLNPSNPHLRQCVASIDLSKPDSVPQIDVSHVFSNPNQAVIQSTIVTVDRHRFLISGYLDLQVPPNSNLYDIFPPLPWHGEIIVFSLGRRVRVLSRPNGARYLLKKAISMYIRAMFEARIGGKPLPQQVNFVPQSIFVL